MHEERIGKCLRRVEHIRRVNLATNPLDIQGFDVKALRAFRVLRPLRLVSRAPSK